MSIVSGPARQKVFLANLGKEVKVNFISLADDQWMKDEYDEDELKNWYEHSDIILGFFWHLVDDDSKQLITDKEFFELEGFEKKKVEFTCPVKKLEYIVQGDKEFDAIFQALIQTRKNSSRAVEEDDQKKSQETVST